MRFFADENFIRRAVDLLKAYDNQRHTFSHLLDHFPRGTPDLEWLPVVAGWDPRPFILSGDGRILRNRSERAALRATSCTYIFLSPGWTNTTWDLYGLKIITHWPRVRERAGQTTHQAVLELTVNGNLQRKSLPGVNGRRTLPDADGHSRTRRPPPGRHLRYRGRRSASFPGRTNSGCVGRLLCQAAPGPRSAQLCSMLGLPPFDGPLRPDRTSGHRTGIGHG